MIPGLSIGADEGNSIQVIVNNQADVTELNRKQVMSLFLGRARNFPNGLQAKPFDNEMGSSVRARFFEQLTGKSISDIDAYWARLRYSGRAMPPKSLDAQDEILSEVSQNENAIGYIDGRSADELASKGIIVVHTIEGR